jgi:hypothetical protein
MRIEININSYLMNAFSNVIQWFGIAYIAIPLIAVFFLALQMIRGVVIPSESLDKILSFGKWYIASVALVFAADIVENGFTERETGIKEMKVYDEYVNTILQADNIEARWKLAEYFSVVTPTDRLRERWIAYKNSLEEDYNKFLELKEQEIQLLSMDSLNTKQKLSLAKIKQQKAVFESSLWDQEK